MTVNSSSLGDVGALATAIGLLGPDGSVDTTWFTDPGGHIRGMLRNQPQRDALVAFIQAALGDQTTPVTDDPGRAWVPLLRLTGTAEAGSDLFLVLEPGGRGVVVSIGVRIEVSAPVAASAQIRLPLLRVNQSESAGVTFLPGLDSADAGDISDATAGLTASVTVADPTLNSVGVTASVPLTFHGGQATAAPSVGIVVRGLRLPGSSEPLDISLGSASAIGPELAHLLAAILQAEAASATGAARDLLGLIGLLPAGGAIPPLPVGDILASGLPALAPWLQSVAATPAAMQAWVGLLADLIGANTAAAGPPYGISLAAGRAELDLTVDVSVDNAGGLVITPGASVRVSTPLAAVSEVSVAADAELARISLGAHPGVQALPYLQLAARYGADTGTIVSVTSPAVVTVGALHAGLGLDNGRKPVFVLGAERVDVGRDASHLDHHDVLDLTSPDALADVGAEALSAIVTGMLAGLGRPAPPSRCCSGSRRPPATPGTLPGRPCPWPGWWPTPWAPSARSCAPSWPGAEPASPTCSRCCRGCWAAPRWAPGRARPTSHGRWSWLLACR